MNAPSSRRLLVVAAAAAALALVGGVAGAVAAVVSRTSTSPSPSASSGASLYFPAIGGQGQQAPQGVSAPQPAPQAAAGVATTMKGDMAYAQAYPGIAYPAMGCGQPDPAQIQGDGITATGMAQVPLGSIGPGATTLNVGVQSNGSGSLRDALSEVQKRLDAIRAAARAAGIPDAKIGQQSLNVWANGGPKVVENSNVNGNLTITIDDPALIDRVVSAVADAGASNLNLWSGGGATTSSPTDAQLRSVITKATAAAKAMAQAEAQGAGLTLGTLRAVVAQPPAVCPWASDGPQVVVAVTVAYTIK